MACGRGFVEDTGFGDGGGGVDSWLGGFLGLNERW